MPNIRAFQGYYYDSDIVGKLEDVVAPPYDVITPSEQKELYNKSPFNIIRIIWGREEVGGNKVSNKYSRAAQYLQDWIGKGVFKKDTHQSIYLLEQKFSFDSKNYSRLGFLALFQLVDFAEGKVFPHEETLGAPKLDRLKLLEATRANFSPIFSFYIDEKNTVEDIFAVFKKEPPFLCATGTDGTRNTVWKLTDKDKIDKIACMMLEKQIFIADGHHRYETALDYKKLHPPKSPDDGVNFVLMYFSNTEQPGMLILPTHRLIKSNINNEREFRAKVEDFFDVQNSHDLKTTIRFVNIQDNMKKFGVFFHDKFFVVTLKEGKKSEVFDAFSAKGEIRTYRDMDVKILDEFLIKKMLDVKIESNINYTKDAEEAVELVRKGLYKIAFFLKPALLSQVKEVALAGERMPKKSTYFYPKLLSGLIINKF